MFGDGRFFTASGRANFLPITPRPPARHTDPAYPLALNTGRVRDHWHTMPRTGKSPRLSGHIGEPFVALHPGDAGDIGLHDGQLAAVISHWGEAVLRVQLTDAQPRGQVFAPMHWNDQFASAARVGSLVNPMVDPVSGQPEFKHTPVRVDRSGLELRQRHRCDCIAKARRASRGTGGWGHCIGRGARQAQPVDLIQP